MKVYQKVAELVNHFDTLSKKEVEYRKAPVCDYNSEYYKNLLSVLRNVNNSLADFIRENLPHGSGLDSGFKVDLMASKPDKIVLNSGFHCMNENGYYDGWLYFKVIIKPSLQYGYTFDFSGQSTCKREYRKYWSGLSDYLYDIISNDLDKEL